MSKGSKQRPKQVSEAEMQRRWDKAFSKPKKDKDKKYHFNIEIK